VPSIDLRATFLCGDRLVVGSARETACLDRASGEVLWRLPSAPALAVVTPAGLARIQGDGVVQVHDFGNGEVVLRARVAPRAGERTSGVVVNAPGLPRLLVIAEAERQLSAIDLGSGEIRWRHSARRAETFRIRRAGRLLVVASGDLALTALDVATGELVWRVRDRLRFASPPSLDGDSLFAIAGEVGSSARVVARLHHLDAWAGTTRWARELPAGTAPNGAPLVAGDVVVVVTRDRRGLGLLALDRSTGETRWSVDPGWAPVRSAWLAVDDAIVCNTEHGAMSALDARNGATLWRHVLARGVEGDQPRKLEPVLRSGALFLPQSAVHVIRPRDGALLGTVPSDIIPDLMRVDERCDVYVAEESGHLAAYSAGARLTLVSAG
jgi:outer membrane protein assembly factor BamB